MFNSEFIEMFGSEIGATLYMVLVSSLVSYVIGLPLGVLSSPPPQAVMLRALAAAMARARILLSFIFHFLLLKIR